MKDGHVKVAGSSDIASAPFMDCSHVGPEVGSAEWHGQLFEKALQRKPNSRGSDWTQSNAISPPRSLISSRNGGMLINAPQISSLDGAERATLQDLHSASKVLEKTVAMPPSSPNTARGASTGQRTPHIHRRPTDNHSNPTTGSRPTNINRPNTTANPREARIKQWHLIEPGSRGTSLDGLRIKSPSGNHGSGMLSDNKTPVQRSLSGFVQYFDHKPSTKVDDQPSLSSVQSASVDAYIAMDESVMSDEELLQTLRRSTHVPMLKVPTKERFAISRRTEQLNQHRKGGHSSDDPEFKSTGLFVHTEVERLRTVDESRKNSKPEEGRLAQCCSLFERLQVKYFDEEFGMLKEELFRAIFQDFETLKQMPVPRSKEAFLGSKPYFELWQLEKDKMEELQFILKKYQDQCNNEKEKVKELEARIKVLKELGNRSRRATKGQGFEREASLSESMLRGALPATVLSSPGSFFVTPRKAPHLNLSPEHSHWPTYAEGSPGSLRTPRQLLKSISSDLTRSQTMHSLSRQASAAAGEDSYGGLGVGRSGMAGAGAHVSSEAAFAAGLAGAAAAAAAAAAGLQTHLSSDTNNPFLAAGPNIQLVASKINNLEDYLRTFRDAVTDVDIKGSSGVGGEGKGDRGTDSVGMHNENVMDDEEEEGKRTKAPPGHTLVMGHKLKRRKGQNEPRWRDFATFLSRHPELRPTFIDGLKEVYSKFCFPFDYKAPFSAMLRALERHNQYGPFDIQQQCQLHILGVANNQVAYTHSLGVDMGFSSDEEENLEDQITSRDQLIVKLQLEKVELQNRLDEEIATHDERLEKRVHELEELSDRLFRAEQNRAQELLQALQDKIEELHGELKAKEKELTKVQYLLQDGDSLVSMVKELKDENELAKKRFTIREKELKEESSKHQDTIKFLQSQLTIAEVLHKESHERMRIKVGFSTQRTLIEEKASHKEQLREIEGLFQQQLQLSELKGNIRHLTGVNMHQTRFNVVMDILQRLDERMDALLTTVSNSAERQSLTKFARIEFSAARGRLLEQVTVNDMEEDSDSENIYRNPAISRVRAHETQTDLTPGDLGLDPEELGGKGKKGKKGGKKGKKAKTALEEPINQEIICAAQGMIDVVYSHLELIHVLDTPGFLVGGGSTRSFSPSRPALCDTVEAGFIERCMLRYMVVKCGHKDVASREIERLKDTLTRMPASNLRCTMFARLCNFFSPMPRPMTQLLVSLKANCWHVSYPALDWSKQVREAGLPLGEPCDPSREGPEARDGVVGLELALTLARSTCRSMELPCDAPLGWLARRVMTDMDRQVEVLSVEAVMIAVTAQMDRKTAELSSILSSKFTPPANPDEIVPLLEEAQPEADNILTLDALQNLLKDVYGTVSQQAAVEVMVDLTKQFGTRVPTPSEVALTLFEHIPAFVANARKDVDETEELGENVYARESFFLTGGGL